MKDFEKLIGKIAIASILGVVSNLSLAHTASGWMMGDSRIMGWNGMMGGPGAMWGGMFMMMVVCVVLFALAIYGLVHLIRSMVRPKPTERRSLQVLEEAYARGDIEREQFLQKWDDLSGKRNPSS